MMGFGDNQNNNNVATSSSGASSSGLSQQERQAYVTEPKKLLDLFKTNHDTACQYMHAFTRHEVRTLLENAANQKLKFDFELFKKLVEDKNSTFAEALLAFYRKSNRPIQGSEFPLYFGVTVLDVVNILLNNAKWNLLSEFFLRLSGESSWKSIIGVYKNTPANKLIQHANEWKTNPSALASIKQCLSVYHEQLYIAFERGVELNSAEESSAIRHYYASIKQINTWVLFDKGSIRTKEIFVKLGSNTTVWSGSSPLLVNEVVKNTGLLFQRLDRISAARYFIDNVVDRKDILDYQPHVGSSRSATAIFFERLFEDVFPYTSTLNFEWLSELDLSAELAKNPESITKIISTIINWEYFNAVFYLLKPLAPQHIATILANLSPEAWERINEFPVQSRHVVTKMVDAMLSLSEDDFANVLGKEHQEILDPLSQIELGKTFELYEKFHGSFDNHPRYNESISRLIEIAGEQAETNVDLVKKFKHIFQRKIQAYINDPSVLVGLFNTHFILAARYVMIMTDDQAKTLVANAGLIKVPLIETIIEILAFGAHGERGNKIRIAKNVSSESNEYSLKDLANNHISVLEMHAVATSSKGFYDKEWRFSRTFNFLGSKRGLWGEKLDDVLHEAAREKVMGLIADSLLRRLIPMLGEERIKWQGDNRITRDIFLGLLQFSNHERIRSILFASGRDVSLGIIVSFIGKSVVFDDRFRTEFFDWLDVATDDVVSILKEMDLANCLILINKINVEKFNELVLRFIHNKPDVVRDCIRWVNGLNVQDKKTVLSYLNIQLLYKLQSDAYRNYGVAVYCLDPSFFKEHYADFHRAMSLMLLQVPNQSLANDIFGAAAPPVSSASVPSAPVPDNVPPPPYHAASQKDDDEDMMGYVAPSIPKEKGPMSKPADDPNGEILKRLDEMQKALALLARPAANSVHSTSVEEHEQLKYELLVKSAMVDILIKQHVEQANALQEKDVTIAHLNLVNQSKQTQINLVRFKADISTSAAMNKVNPKSEARDRSKSF